MTDNKDIKCVVWDLDGTLWNGVLLEDDAVQLRSDIKNIIQTLDRRGIMQSIASKNDHDAAMEKIRDFELDEYFLCPEIHWNAKSLSMAKIQANLNINMDSILFIDDEAYERDEVQSVHPEIICMEAREYDTLLAHPRLNPRFITEDSARRRRIYLEQQERKIAEEEFAGPRDEFLTSLQMRLTIGKATENDLRRAEELTIRTNQLNTTGETYDYDELRAFINSPRHELYICELQDRYGYQGKIGLALIDIDRDCHHLKLLIMSCRVMSLGVGTVLLSYIMNKAKQSGKELRADFKHTGRNRPMYITFKMSNFKEAGDNSVDDIVLENDLSFIPPYPPYLELSVPNESRESIYDRIRPNQRIYQE
jgi:FkbH-like protein